jgi:DNA repair exonuclease SbcCD ATPase subunit
MENKADLDALDRMREQFERNVQPYDYTTALHNAYPALAAELREARKEVLRLQQTYAASAQDIAKKSRELYESGRRISNQRKHLADLEKRVRDLQTEIEVRDSSANLVLDTLKAALPNRGFHSEMEAAEAAAKEIADLRAKLNERTMIAARAQESLRLAMAGVADRGAVWAAYGNADSARSWLDARDRRMKSLGAVEALRNVVVGPRNRHIEVYDSYCRGVHDEAQAWLRSLEAYAAELEAAAREGEGNG